MKYVLLLILFTTTTPLLSQNIVIKVQVDCNDANIANKIKSRVNNKLRGLNKITLTESDTALFRFSIIGRSLSNTVIVLTTILTKKVTCGSEKIQHILLSVTNVEEIINLEQKCDDLVARFDTNFFESERN